jgi:uncharacterized protein HemY
MNLKALIITASVTASSLAIAAGGDFLLTVNPGMSAQQYYAEAQNYAAEARATYSFASADLPLWNRAIANAEAAVNLEPNSPIYLRTAAMYYAQTQWWLPAFEHFAELRAQVSLDDTALDMAALTARKLGYMAMQRGDRGEARLYYTESLTYRDSESARQMLAKLENTL